jgi:NhaA family Na+:H+ antiporter
MTKDRAPMLSLAAPVRALFVKDWAAGALLIVVAAMAMIMANSPWAHDYHDFFHQTFVWSPIGRLSSMHLWINDGLMAVFFFVVGLEVKREMIEGSLASAEQRRLPVLAAVAGMAVPAAIYLLVVNGNPQLHRGWAIPAATDIAFAMGVIGLLGSRVPPSLRLFLLTVAIVDDIGAVLIIALFYTSGLEMMWLAGGVLILGAMIALNRAGVSRLWPFAILAGFLWFCVLHSGVHATIAGVAAALTIPMVGKDDDTMLERTEHALAPWSAYLIVPLFGFANAGVNLSGVGVEGLLAPLPLGIAVGLVAGKQLGIFTAIAAAHAVGFAPKLSGASWPAIWGMSILCGIGFTMSLFITELAFVRSQVLIDEAKIGILAGSFLSAVLGFIVLRLVAVKSSPETDSTA